MGISDSAEGLQGMRRQPHSISPVVTLQMHMLSEKGELNRSTESDALEPPLSQAALHSKADVKEGW